MNQDLEHLRMLSIFHYVFAGLAALPGCFSLIYAGLGLMFILMPQGPGEQMPPAVGAIMLGFSLVFLCVIGLTAFLLYRAGRCLATQQSHTYCMVIAAMNCLFVPLGTILGVFTLIVLTRPSVKQLFVPRGPFG